MYIMRLDDASEHMDINKWLRMEGILNKYNIKPIFGIIPDNKDPDLLKYPEVEKFWELMNRWKNNGWEPALHGYQHVFETSQGGINPVNSMSEFAGLPYDVQCKKISSGYDILVKHGINPKIFFAPAHTFDAHTLKALKQESPIRVVSDTVANDVYCKDGIFFIPQQSGQCRKLPFKVVTFCYHPNIMTDKDFYLLENFLKENYLKFVTISKVRLKKRSMNLLDDIIKKMYFGRRKK